MTLMIIIYFNDPNDDFNKNDFYDNHILKIIFR